MSCWRSLVYCAAIVVALSVTPAAAQQSCAGALVSARGEPASYQWLALIKARGNWRSKVRALPGLGSDYANWSRAEGAVERCISGAGSIACTVTAMPCKAP